MLEMMNGLHSGGSFGGVTVPHRGTQYSHVIKVRGKCLYSTSILDEF